jgi:hypothetical protein
MAQGTQKTLYKGILLLHIEEYKIAPKAMQYIRGFIDTAEVTQCPHTLYFTNQHKVRRKELR